MAIDPDYKAALQRNARIIRRAVKGKTKPEREEMYQAFRAGPLLAPLFAAIKLGQLATRESI